jgi:hypothetical protein
MFKGVPNSMLTIAISQRQFQKSVPPSSRSASTQNWWPDMQMSTPLLLRTRIPSSSSQLTQYQLARRHAVFSGFPKQNATVPVIAALSRSRRHVIDEHATKLMTKNALLGSNHLVLVVATTSCCNDDQAKSWPSSAGLRGHRKTYLTILKRIRSTIIKMV